MPLQQGYGTALLPHGVIYVLCFMSNTARIKSGNVSFIIFLAVPSGV